jgi:hypothetical protein
MALLRNELPKPINISLVRKPTKIAPNERTNNGKTMGKAAS